MKKIHIQTTEKPEYQRGLFWYIGIWTVLCFMAIYFVSQGEYLSLVCFSLVAAIYYFFSFRAKNQRMKIVFSKNGIRMRTKVYPLSRFNGFYFFEESETRPPVLVLRGSGLSHSIPIPVQYKFCLLDWLHKTMKPIEKPSLTDKLCHLLKL